MKELMYVANKNIRKLIRKVEIDRRTKKCVWINGVRHNISSEWDSYHDTWDGAKTKLLEDAELNLAKYQRYLDQARTKLEAVKSLKSF